MAERLDCGHYLGAGNCTDACAEVGPPDLSGFSVGEFVRRQESNLGLARAMYARARHEARTIRWNKPQTVAREGRAAWAQHINSARLWLSTLRRRIARLEAQEDD